MPLLGGQGGVFCRGGPGPGKWRPVAAATPQGGLSPSLLPLIEEKTENQRGGVLAQGPTSVQCGRQHLEPRFLTPSPVLSQGWGEGWREPKAPDALVPTGLGSSVCPAGRSGGGGGGDRNGEEDGALESGGVGLASILSPRVTWDGSPPSSEPPSFRLYNAEVSLTDSFLLSGFTGMVPHPQVPSAGRKPRRDIVSLEITQVFAAEPGSDLMLDHRQAPA